MLDPEAHSGTRGSVDGYVFLQTSQIAVSRSDVPDVGGSDEVVKDVEFRLPVPNLYNLSHCFLPRGHSQKSRFLKEVAILKIHARASTRRDRTGVEREPSLGLGASADAPHERNRPPAGCATPGGRFLHLVISRRRTLPTLAAEIGGDPIRVEFLSARRRRLATQQCSKPRAEPDLKHLQTS